MNINIDIMVKVIIPILGAILTYLIVPFIKQYTLEATTWKDVKHPRSKEV